MIDMAETQWEYCRLYIGHPIKHTKAVIFGMGSEFQGIGIDCNITYYANSGEVIIQKISINTEVSKNQPFSTTMGLLGARCWELVNIQHGNLATISGNVYPEGTENIWDTISMKSIVAYFKRPVLSGRAVNEPKIEIIK